MLWLLLTLVALASYGAYLVWDHGSYAGFGLGPILLASLAVLSCIAVKLMLPISRTTQIRHSADLNEE